MCGKGEPGAEGKRKREIRMEIVEFTENYITEARRLAAENYEEERAHVPTLPGINEIPMERELTANGLGTAAVEHGRLLGFWGCVGPWEREYGSLASGVFTPIHAHGAVQEGRAELYRRMYQALADKLVRRGIAYHSISVYAHDTQALSGLFTYGFGMRCVDAVRDMKEVPVPGGTAGTVVFRESGQTDFPEIRKLRAGLGRHLGESPCFIMMDEDSIANWQQRKESGGVRMFTAWNGKEPVAYLEITDEGENFVTGGREVQNVCGAYCMPQYRGRGIMQMLVNYVMGVLQAEGYTKLGVDYESINPTAWGFWNKYFEAYTYSLTRRIVESACREGFQGPVS